MALVDDDEIVPRRHERQARVAPDVPGAARDEHLDFQRLSLLVEHAVVVRVQPTERIERPLCFLRVVLDDRDIGVVRPLVRCERTVHRSRRAVVEVLDDRLQIDALRQRTSHAFV